MIAKNFDLVDGIEIENLPKLILEDENTDLWFQQDKEFK